MVLPLLLTGLPGDIEDHVELALAGQSEPNRTLIRLLVGRAVIAYARGDRERERASFQQAVAASEQLADEREHLLTLAGFAKAVTSGDQPSVDAHELLSTAKVIAESTGELALQQLVHGLRVEAYVADERLEEAEAAFEAALTDSGARHFALLHPEEYQAFFAYLHGHFGDALNSLMSSLALSRAQGMEFDMAWQLQMIGCCLIALDRPRQGISLIAAGEAKGARHNMEGRPGYLSRWVSKQTLLAERKLGEPTARRAQAQGRELRWDAAVGMALRARTIAGDRGSSGPSHSRAQLDSTRNSARASELRKRSLSGEPRVTADVCSSRALGWDRRMVAGCLAIGGQMKALVYHGPDQRS